MSLIKQLAIASSTDGVIGYNDSLLFESRLDMRNFAVFTHNTVMIAGRKTVEEMLNIGCKPHPLRPFVVVTENALNISKSASVPNDLYYARDLTNAISVAQAIAESTGLGGWTIIGGASIYNQVYAMELKLDRLYVAEFTESTDSLDPAKLIRLDKLTLAEYLARLTNKMVSPVTKRITAAVPMRSKAPRSGVHFTTINDTYFVDDSAVAHSGNRLTILCDLGRLQLDLRVISSYVRLRERPIVQLAMHGGGNYTLRLETEAQANYLIHLLDGFFAS